MQHVSPTDMHWLQTVFAQLLQNNVEDETKQQLSHILVSHNAAASV
jgi:hypothetical protein